MLCLKLELEVFQYVVKGNGDLRSEDTAPGKASLGLPTASELQLGTQTAPAVGQDKSCLFGKKTTCFVRMKFSFHSPKFLLMQLYGLGVL